MRERATNVDQREGVGKREGDKEREKVEVWKSVWKLSWEELGSV